MYVSEKVSKVCMYRKNQEKHDGYTQAVTVTCVVKRDMAVKGERL